MAKRSRLAARPGQRRPLQRNAPRPVNAAPDAAPRPTNSVTDEEMARAAELEASILAEEQAAQDARANRERGRRGAPAEALPEVSRSAVPLSVREAAEYRYVQRDVRRIAIVGGFLLLILAVLDVLVNGLHLFTL
jgi:hypothetical protein